MKKTITTRIPATGLTAGELLAALADVHSDARVTVHVDKGDRPWDSETATIIITETKES